MAVVFPPVRVSADFIDYPYFADLGAIQAAATLRAAGADVTLADAFALAGSTLSRTEGTDLVLGASEDELFAAIPAAADAIVIALTPFHRPPGRDESLGAVLARLRREHPETPLLVGDLYQSGQHVVDAPSAAILASYPEIDVLLRHEAEADLPSIAGDLVENGRRAAGAGTGTEGRTELHVGRRAVDGVEPSPLDALPLPAWDLVDLPAYFGFHERVVERLGRPRWAFPITSRSAPVLTSRGCPYRCVHCSSNPSSRKNGVQIAPKTQRRYSPDYLDRLFADLVARGVRRVHLLDELVNVNEAHFDAVMALLSKHGLAFEIPNGVRADYVQDRHLEKMRGRLTTLSVSAESGVQSVIDRVVDKKLDLAAIRSVAERARAADVKLLVHFMIGLPGESRQDIGGTLEFAVDLFERTGAEPSMQFATPLPGTRLAKMAEDASGPVGRGRVLPVVRDYGPLFQQHPSIATGTFTTEHLRAARAAFDRRMTALRGPKKVVLNVTYRCNSRCTFCATGTRAQVDGSFEAHREVLVRHRKQGATLLDLDGGEPTLNAKLLPLIGFARKIGYERVHLTTNGRMAAYPEFAEKLAHSGLTSILVSIHGPDAATHAASVGVAEAFDQACAGVRNLVRAAPPHLELGAAVAVTRSNVDRLQEVASLAESLGLRWLEVQILTPLGKATRAVAPDAERAATAVMRTIDAFATRMKIRVKDLPPCYLPGYEQHVMDDASKLAGRTVFADHDEVRVFEYLRQRRVKKPVCGECPHAVFCDGFHDMEGAPEPSWLPVIQEPARDDAPPAPP